ncbi:hypothetical protein F5X96DRAFT_655628 [Biscogniauxia mediterranea]|nr:hypothetical protein F5X96DRAFT_655628 [Biscogniauxia mediterranea]
MPPLHCANASTTSAAKLFLQLCARRSSVAPISPASSILDVLLPPRTRTFHLPPAARSPSRPAAATMPGGTRYFKQGVAPPPPPPPSQRRGFASTGTWRKTQVIYNPQRDEDGNVMLLEITPRAANRLSQIMAKDGNPHLALRIQVESGGCHGFQYLMSLTTLPPDPSASASASSPSPTTTTTATEAVTPSTTTSSDPAAAARLSEEDTVFAFVPDSNPSSSAPEQQQQQQQEQPDALPATTSSTAGLPKVVLDGPSLELLKGSKVDFTMELIGSQFKIVDNPLATSSCGCGTSFDIKF